MQRGEIWLLRGCSQTPPPRAQAAGEGRDEGGIRGHSLLCQPDTATHAFLKQTKVTLCWEAAAWVCSKSPFLTQWCLCHPRPTLGLLEGGEGVFGSSKVSFTCSAWEEEGEMAAHSVEVTHLDNGLKRSLLMMQQEFAISLIKLRWKPQLEGQQ